jgi:hypothetical protein
MNKIIFLQNKYKIHISYNKYLLSNFQNIKCIRKISVQLQQKISIIVK